MSTPLGILNQLKTQFQGSSNLSSVANEAIMVSEEDTETNLFPALIITPVRNQESIEDFGYNDVSLNLFAVIVGHVKNYDHDSKITDLMNLENNVKKAIYEDPQINDLAVYTYIEETLYYKAAGDPIATFTMGIRIEYTQDKATRT